MDKDIAIKNLIDFTDVLSKYKARWFLSHGTCLGAIRENAFIGHDKDMDIGIMQEDFHFDMLNDLLDIGFEVRFIFGMRFKGFEIAFYRDGVKIDLMFHYTYNDKVVNVLWRNGGRNGFDDAIVQVYPKSLFDRFITCSMYNHNFFVPLDYIGYIRCIYGHSWQVPDTDWKWWESPHNIVKGFKL